MELNFEKGTKDGPVGHALIYFTHINDNSRVSASYVVLLPIKVDISKYIPPFLSGQIEALGKNDMSHFAFPPTPEPVESLDALRKIADIRKDDLINGGNHNLDEVTSMLSLIAEFAEEYVKINPEPTLDAPVVTENTDDVDDVVLQCRQRIVTVVFDFHVPYFVDSSLMPCVARYSLTCT